MVTPDPEWEILRAFCNRVLREGMEREAKQWVKANERVKKYRDWLKHRGNPLYRLHERDKDLESEVRNGKIIMV